MSMYCILLSIGILLCLMLLDSGFRIDLLSTKLNVDSFFSKILFLYSFFLLY